MPHYRWLFHISSRAEPKPCTSNLSPLFYAVMKHTQYQARVKLTGSFRLSAGRGHLHPHCIFTELLPETVPQSLRHSCTSELTRQGISLNYSSKLDSIFILRLCRGQAFTKLIRVCGVGLSLTTLDYYYISVAQVAYDA